MDSQHTSQAVIKTEICDDWNAVHQFESLGSSGNKLDILEEFKQLSDSTVKHEEFIITTARLPERHVPIAFKQTPPFDPNTNVSTCLGLQELNATSRKSKLPYELLRMKKLMQLTLPRKCVFSRWTTHTTQSILRFLRSFVSIARGSRLSHSADKCLSLNAPRILICEECLFEVSGLYDRYLKLFIHYKTDHKLKCNMLIGRKWIKHKASLDVMVQAWKLDLKCEVRKLLSSPTCCGPCPIE